MIEILNVGVAGRKVDIDGNVVEGEVDAFGTVRIIVYKEDDIENTLNLPKPNMDNFIPIEEIDTNKLIEWVEALK
jgi:hypothetical protein